MKWADTDSKELQLNEVAKELLEIIVTYIYTGTYEVNPASILSLIVPLSPSFFPTFISSLFFSGFFVLLLFFLLFLTQKDIWEVLATAGQFLLPRLQQELEHEVMKNYLDVDSCIELATAADIHLLVLPPLSLSSPPYVLFFESSADALGNSKIFKASVRVIANNLTTLSSTPPFLALPLYMRDEVMNFALPKRSRHP